MKRETRLFFIALLAALLLAAPAAAGAPGTSTSEAARRAWAERDPSVPFDDQFAYEQNWRAGFDFLDAEDEMVHLRMAAAPKNGSYERYGLALTDDELVEVDRRMRIQQNFADVVAAAVGADWSEELVEGLDPGASFGPVAGYWTDQHDGGRLQLALVSDDRRASAVRGTVARRVAEMVRQGRLTRQGDVRIREARFSLDDIYAVNRDFAARYLPRAVVSWHDSSDPEADTGFPEAPDEVRRVGMSVSINVRANRADLFAEPGWQAEAWRFARRYPTGLVRVVRVRDDALAGQANLKPRDDWGWGKWHTGASIRLENGSGTSLGNCTWGASAKTASYVYVVTAAHCIGFNSPNYGAGGWFNANEPAGNRRKVESTTGGDTITPSGSGYVRYYNGPRGDIAALAVTNHNATADYSCYLSYDTWCNQHITGRATTTNTIVGNHYYAALGSTNGYRNFPLLTNDAPLSGRDWMRALDSNGGTIDGDSGAGWKAYDKLYGINYGKMDPDPNWSYPSISGLTGDDAVFTHAYYIEASGYLSRTVCGGGGHCDD